MSYPEQEKNTENKVSNLLYRSGVYYFYCRIPSHLQHFFPHTETGNFQKHIKRTLKTKTHDEAIERIKAFNAQYSDLIKVLEVKSMPESTVKQHIRAFGFKFPDDEVPEPVKLVATPKKAKKYMLSQLMDLYTSLSKEGWSGRTPRSVAHSLRIILYVLGDIPTIFEILKITLPPEERIEFRKWYGEVAKKDFLRVLPSFFSDDEVKESVADYVIEQLKQLEHSCGIGIHAVIKVDGRTYLHGSFNEEYGC